jgi:hypothetical protein
MLHARGLVRAVQGHTDEAEGAFLAALEIIEPAMYAILSREIRASLDSLYRSCPPGRVRAVFVDQNEIGPLGRLRCSSLVAMRVQRCVGASAFD